MYSRSMTTYLLCSYTIILSTLSLNYCRINYTTKYFHKNFLKTAFFINLKKFKRPLVLTNRKRRNYKSITQMQYTYYYY